MKAPSAMAVRAYGLCLIVAILDQISKVWVLQALGAERGASMAVWGPLRMTLVLNGGVSFGLLQGDGSWVRWALAGFEAAIMIVLGIWVRRTDRLLMATSIGLIMGGALGNVIDRARFGFVVDFIDAQGLFFPWVFNLADSAITLGVTLLLIENIWLSKSRAS